MAVLFVLILTGVFHGYVSGYPAAGMLKIIPISFFFSFRTFFSFFNLSHCYSVELTTGALVTLV